MSYVVTTYRWSGPIDAEATTRAAALELAFTEMALGLGAVTITDTTDGRRYPSSEFGKFLHKVRSAT